MKAVLTAVVAAVTLAATLRAVPAALPELLPPPPERLSETGLYLPGGLTVDARNRPYSPQYPLWTDGAEKSRWVRLPPGGRIDVRAADAWIFPVGTMFWKEFAFGGRRIETRVLRRSTKRAWSYASYVWNDAQTDARLAPDVGVPAAAEIAPGKRHDIPARTDCQTCHENGATPVLGFTALQLSDDRDPRAPHGERLQPDMVTLRTLRHEHLVTPAHPSLTERAPRIPGEAAARAALGYLTANCGHCHNERSPVATVRYPLRFSGFESAPDTEDVVARLIARATAWDLPGREPGRSSMIEPGVPDQSVILARMRSRRPSSQMPPLGTVLPDRQALDLITTWIAAMPRR